MIEFRDNDDDYVDWLAAHRGGYVINIARSYNPSDARLHLASCRSLTDQISRGVVLTGPYVKECSHDLDELEQWAADNVGAPIQRCGTCHRARNSAPPKPPKPPKSAKPTLAPPAPEGRRYIRGPVVEAWADDYIRFERRPPWQEHLRDEIRSRCRQLDPSDGWVLHATFFGDKHPNADVENYVLYYIDSFRAAGRNGIRFEHGAAVPPAPDGTDYPYCYRYELAPWSGTFSDWQPVRKLASFDWINLDSFDGEKKLAKVWLALSRALARGEVEVFETASPGTPFAVRVELRPPHGRKPVWGNLVKEIFDGVICAFQAHIDTGGLDGVVERLGNYLPADPQEIRRLLLDQNWAVLGAVLRLVYPFGSGVKWDPADHWCVAGELLAAEPDEFAGSGWAIKGDLVELSRRPPDGA
jgi:hypothetical protein